MYNGFILKLPDEALSLPTKQFISQILLQQSDSLTYTHSCETHDGAPTDWFTLIKFKTFWDFKWPYAKNDLTSEDCFTIMKLLKSTNMCQKDGCFEQAALEEEVLFDQYGEEMHDVFQHCRRHIAPASRQLLKTLEYVELTPPGERYWEKIALWQSHRYWYAQYVYLYEDGDYECGYHDCLAASERVGPHPTKEAALEEAKAKER